MRRILFLIAILIFVPSVCPSPFGSGLCWGQFATQMDSSDVAGWNFTTFTDVDDSLTAGYQIYQKIDSTTAVIDSAVGAERATDAGSSDTTTAAFLHRSGGTMTGNITMPDDGWIGGGADKGRMVYKDETQDTVMFWDCHIRAETIHATQLNSGFGVYSGNGLVVASGTVDLTGATVNLPSNAVDASSEIATQIIVSDDVDSTDEDFVFDGAYHKTSEEADSAYMTKGYIDASDDTVTAYRAAIHDTLLAIITSANWAGRVSDETGTGLWVFGTSPTFTTDITSPLLIGGTATTSDLSLKTTSGVGETGADMHFLVGNNGATEAMTILNNGNVGIGTAIPSSITHIKGNTPGTVGSHSAGQLIIQNPANSVYANAVITGYESDGGGNPDQQLWYLGGSSGSSSDVTLLNRRNSKLHLGANGATKMTILGDGNVGIGTLNPPERLSVVGNIATGDSIPGDIDVFHYFSTDGSWTTEYLKYDDGLGEFQFSDDLTATSYGGITEANLLDKSASEAITGAWDFGGAASLEIPAVDDPTTDAEGEVAWDTNDDAIEVYMGDEGESALIPAYQKIDALIFAPDGVNDEIAIMHVDALLYPFGIEIDQVSITLPADAAYAMPFEEWAGDPPVWQSLIDSVVTTGTDSYMEDGTPADGAIDADDYIFLDIPATDVDWIHVQVIFHVNDGN